jgi:uncharacterized protein YndB with AHSA1/START domain
VNTRERYRPGPATGGKVEKDGDKWALVLVRELRHPPARVWQALTDPAHLTAWAPFDADRNLGAAGPVMLKTMGSPEPQVAESLVKRAEEPRLLEMEWGGNDLRWTLEPNGSGTRLTLWHNIPRGYIAWGAAGWHICIDVLDHLLLGDPMGRIIGPDAMNFDWQRLNSEYAAQFGIKTPDWSPNDAKS